MNISIDVKETTSTDIQNSDSSNSKNNIFDSKIEADMKTIKSMGYDEKIIRKVYIILKPTELNEALDYLSQEDGIYHHDFMETHGKIDQCFICGEPPQNHINYEPKSTIIEKLRDSIGHKSTGRNSNNSQDENLKLNEPLIELKNSEKNDNNNEENDSEPTYCDLCTDEMKKGEIKNNELPCTIKDCESYAKREGDEKYVTCLEGHKFCFDCSKPPHGNKKCQDEIDKDFKKWKKNKLVKRCPKCKFWTEKNLGCNHMTCPECKYEWCWLCKSKCEKGHFKIGGGCYGLQFTKINCWNNCLFLYGYKFLMWCLQSLMIIFYAPIIMFIFGISYDNQWRDIYPKFIYFPTVILFTISFFILFTGLGLIFFVITLPAYCLKNKAIAFLLDLMGH